MHRVIQFNQKAWKKPYVDMKTKLRKKSKNEFEKDFFKLMNNYVFGKTMENVRKHGDIKLLTTDEKRNKLVSEPNYHTTKHFSEDFLAIETKKTKVKMNMPVYLNKNDNTNKLIIAKKSQWLIKSTEQYHGLKVLLHVQRIFVQQSI